MKFKDKLQELKDKLKKAFNDKPIIERPGIAVIYNSDNKDCTRCAELLKEDCEEIGINWFSVVINENTDPDFLQNSIDIYTEMDDIDMIIIFSPLPKKMELLDNLMKSMNLEDKYKKLLYTKVLYKDNILTRLVALQMLYK